MKPPHPPWFQSRFPDAEQCVVPAMLRRAAQARPEALCVRFDDGTRWSYAEAWAMAQQGAAVLARLGVRKGDLVLVWLPNGPALIRAWFAINTLGAVYVPINTAYRGNLLEHALRKTRAKLLIAHAALIDRLAEVDPVDLESVVVCGGGTFPALDGVAMLGEAVLETAAPAIDLPELRASDITTVLFTSGTTGPAKGVLNPYAQHYTSGMAAHGYLQPSDCIYIFTPLFHTLAIGAVFAALNRGAGFHLAESFHATSFWQDIEKAGCNRILGLISTMAAFLAGGAGPERGCAFDFAMMSPITAETSAFAKKLGFGYFSAFSMTEVSVPVLSDVDSARFGSAGRPRDGVEARIVDDQDCEVPVGDTGELILRSEHPWTFNAGYLDDAEATAQAWRNGWFHTGDAFRCDAEGYYYFVDRLKDSIRRRGENISSYEVEREIAACPGVLDVAVIGVPDAYGGDEVMAVIAPAPGETIDPAALTAFLLPRLAHFMVPRFIRIVASLPKTSTAKVRKDELRAQGVTRETWDREAAGITIKREKIG